MKKQYAMFLVLITLLVCDAFADLQLGVTIPDGEITIDGQATDWAGIDPIVLDDVNDTTCGVLSDISYVFLAKDDEFLYWRIDTNGGNFDSYDYPPVVRFLSHVPSAESSDGDIEASVWDDEGRIDIYSESIHEWNDRYLDGSEYGAIDQIAEGKIPLSLFDTKSYTFAEAFFYNGVDGGGTCDEATLSQSTGSSGGSGGGGSGGGGGCFVRCLK
jgi:uncharacterized membrane protein YgcG